MDRMLYVAMTGAKQLMQAQALVANNLANVSTTGFRADLARFDAEQVQGPGYPSRINTVAAGVGFDSTQGTLVQTGSVLDVAIDGNQVEISAEVKHEKEVKDGEKVLRSERYYGKVYRAFTLGQPVDEASAAAKYADGVLELTLPKKAAVQAKRITIQ